MNVAAEDSSAVLTLAPSLITVLGVLIIGAVTMLMNRRFHLDRLAREESTTRREAFTRLLATMQEKPGFELEYRNAKQALTLVTSLHNGTTYPEGLQIEAGRILQQASDRALRAAAERDRWSSRMLADQYAALATITDETSPLILTVKLPTAMELSEDGYVEAMELFIESLRVDAIMNPRKRAARERDLQARIVAKYPRELLFGEQESISAP